MSVISGFTEFRMDSHSSVSSDSLASDVISQLFAELPSLRSSDHTKFDYSVLQLFSLLLAKTPFGWISWVTIVFMSLEIYAVANLPSITIVIENAREEGKPVDLFTQILYFLIHFRTPSFDGLPSMSYYYFMDLVSFLCITVFILCLIAVSGNKGIPKVWAKLIKIILVDIPSIMVLPIAQMTAEIIFSYISGTSNISIIQLVFSTVFCCAMAFLFYTVSIYVHNSVFFSGGDIISSATSNESMMCWGIVMMFYILVKQILTVTDARNLTCILLMVVGLIELVRSFTNYYLLYYYQTLSIARGITGMIAGVIGILATAHLGPFEKNCDISYVLVFSVFTVVYSVATYLKHLHKKHLAKILYATTDPKHLNLKGNIRFIELVQVGLEEMIPIVVDDDFIEHGMTKYLRPTWVVTHILRIGGMFPGKHNEYLTSLRETLGQVHLTNQERFMIFEYDRVQFLRWTNGAPREVVQHLTACENRISSYAQLRNYLCFRMRAEGNPEITFMIVNALSSMNTMVKEYVAALKRVCPNSPDVLHLYAMYLGTVRQNYTMSSRVNSIADDIARKTIQYADFSHVRILSSFPKARACLIQQKDNNDQHVSRLNFAKVRRLSSLHSIPQSTKAPTEKRASSGTSPMFATSNIYVFVYTLLLLATAGMFIACFGVTENTLDKAVGQQTVLNTLTDMIGTEISAMLDTTEYFYYENFGFVGRDELGVNLRDIYTQFGDTVQSTGVAIDSLMFVDRDPFNKHWGWLNYDVIAVPSYLAGTDVWIDFMTMMSRTRKLLVKICGGRNGNCRNTSESGMMLHTIMGMNNTVHIALNKMITSYSGFSDYLLGKLYKKLFQSAIPFFVILCLMVLCPILVYVQIHRYAALFPESEQSKTLVAIKLYLSHFFHQFSYYFIMSAGIGILCTGTVVGFIMLVHVQARKTFGYLNEKSTCLRKRYSEVSVMTDSVNWLFASQLRVPDFTIRMDDITQAINRDIAYMGSYKADTFNASVTIGMFAAMVQLTYQVNTNTIQFDKNGSTTLKNQLKHEMFPIMYSRANKTKEIMESVIYELREYLTDTNIGFMVIVIVMELCLIPIVYKLSKAVNCIIEEVSYLSDAQIAQSKNGNIKGNNILELVANPCALVDETARVIRTNTAWLTYYDESFDRIVGHSIELTHDNKFTITRIPGTGNSIVTLKETKEDQAVQAKISNAQRDLDFLKGVTTPKRFLRILSGHETVPFALILKVMLVPGKLEKLRPDIWPNDCQTFEDWLRTRAADLPIEGDVDILHTSFRDITIIFGCGQVHTPHMLTMSAAILSFDILRFALETNWPCGALNVCVTLSCGRNLGFDFTRSDVTDVSVLGLAAERQMTLREIVENNSVAFCRETMAVLEDMKFRVDMQQTRTGDYIFVADEPEEW